MNILHTSDWHLGKYLELHSRLPEQEEFIDELLDIVEKNEVDVLLIAGDIFDTINPPASAYTLFYQALMRLSDHGKRLILLVAGNHDSPERLMASTPLALQLSILILGTPNSTLPEGEYEHYSILESDPGFIKIKFREQILSIITLPYPSEKRINEIIENQEEGGYSDKIAVIFSSLESRFSEKSINLAVAHFYLIGGQISRSERDIQLGGAYAVEKEALPKTAQYIAMGHLHRSQKIGNAYYSGSPIQYDRAEADQAKSVNLIKVQPGQEAVVEKLYLKNYKPIAIWRTQGIEEAIALCERRQEEKAWVFLEIETDRTLLQSEIREIKRLRPDIIEIYPILKSLDSDMGLSGDLAEEGMSGLNVMEEFQRYFTESKGFVPSEGILKLFSELLETATEEETERATISLGEKKAQTVKTVKTVKTAMEISDAEKGDVYEAH